jgi:hypothetical protein
MPSGSSGPRQMFEPRIKPPRVNFFLLWVLYIIGENGGQEAKVKPNFSS